MNIKKDTRNQFKKLGQGPDLPQKSKTPSLNVKTWCCCDFCDKKMQKTPFICVSKNPTIKYPLAGSEIIGKYVLYQTRIMQQKKKRNPAREMHVEAPGIK